MGILDLLGAASVAVMKTLIISAIGAFLALDRFHLLNDSARHHLNQVVFYVFNPSLVGGNLARTITFESFISLWFMPINILITFIIGSVLGWILVKITNPPKHLNGLIIGSCSAGNMGLFPIIIISAICKEKASPFGEPQVCEKLGQCICGSILITF